MYDVNGLDILSWSCLLNVNPTCVTKVLQHGNTLLIHCRHRDAGLDLVTQTQLHSPEYLSKQQFWEAPTIKAGKPGGGRGLGRGIWSLRQAQPCTAACKCCRNSATRVDWPHKTCTRIHCTHQGDNMVTLQHHPPDDTNTS